MKFPWQKNTPLLNEEERLLIINAIRQAEKQTSGEVRVFVESKCSWVNALDRAAEVFFTLKMDQTEERNAVLVYAALKDRQLAVFGDEGIYRKTGQEYWNGVVNEMLDKFNHHDYAQGITGCVMQIGEALHVYFPYNKEVDKNELPDEIVFGH